MSKRSKCREGELPGGGGRSLNLGPLLELTTRSRKKGETQDNDYRAPSSDIKILCFVSEPSARCATSKSMQMELPTGAQMSLWAVEAEQFRRQLAGEPAPRPSSGVLLFYPPCSFCWFSNMKQIYGQGCPPAKSTAVS
jgi:hypothetical protein